MKNRIVRLVIALVLVLILAFGLANTFGKPRGSGGIVDLSSGWKTEDYIPPPFITSPEQLGQCDTIDSTQGFPFTIRRPVIDHVTDCFDETNSTAKFLNIFTYIVLAVGIIYCIVTLKRTGPGKKQNDRAAKTR